MKFVKQLATGGVGGVLLAVAGTAAATNGDQMIGITATQMGMAGAVLAAPQDAATMIYNPAGVAQLGIEEVRFDSGFGLLNPTRKANGFESDSNYYLMPAGAAAFKMSDSAYFGMAMGGISGMGVDYLDVAAAPANQTVVTTKQFFKISPGVGFKVSDDLSLGAAINIGYQSLAMYTNQSGTLLSLPQNQVYGAGYSIGAIYRIGEKVQLGANFISKTDMNEFEWNTVNGKFSMNMDQPAQYGIGAAFMPAGGLLVEADVKIIKFGDVLDKIELVGPNGAVASTMQLGWDDQTVYALGVQKDVGETMKVRVGYNYGKSPIGPEDVNFNFGSPAVVEQHITLGFTKNFNKRASGSLSFMHAPNNQVTSNVSTNTIELEQNQLNFQLSYKY